MADIISSLQNFLILWFQLHHLSYLWSGTNVHPKVHHNYGSKISYKKKVCITTEVNKIGNKEHGSKPKPHTLGNNLFYSLPEAFL